MIRATEVQQPKRIRCAVYTRKSTEDGLEQEFNIQTRISVSERRHTELEEQIASLQAKAPRQSDIADSLARFDELWQSMKPKDRCGLIELLVARIDYDGVQGNVEIHFHNTGIATFGTTAESPEDNA